MPHLHDKIDFPVLCFGEVLWDCLPMGLFLGGAPVNVAYHLAKLGLHPIPVTAVGADFLGEEIARRFKRLGLPMEGVAVIPDKPTGAVLVELDAHGVPAYRILEEVAWDWIPLTETVRTLARSCLALVFGSLAQRTSHNRRQWEDLSSLGNTAQKVFDVNLRPPFVDRDLALSWCRRSDLIKLNLEELAWMLERTVAPDGMFAGAKAFQDMVGCPRICVTAGAQGAGLLWEGAWCQEAALPVTVRDTVGAGDAFLAALLRSWLVDQLPAPQALRRACRLAEFVASQEGAMPNYVWSADEGCRAL